MAEMMTKCKEANVNASPAKVFLDYWIPNCSSIYIRLVKLYKWKKVRRLLPRVLVRRKSTHLVRWNWQLLFGMAVKEHQKNFAFPREMKKKNPGSYKNLYWVLWHRPCLLYEVKFPVSVPSHQKTFMSPDKFSSSKSSRRRRFQAFAVCYH